MFAKIHIVINIESDVGLRIGRNDGVFSDALKFSALVQCTLAVPGKFF